MRWAGRGARHARRSALVRELEPASNGSVAVRKPRARVADQGEVVGVGVAELARVAADGGGTDRRWGPGEGAPQAAPSGGSHLARRSQRALFAELARRLEHVGLAGEPQRIKSSFVVGYEHLPIRYRLARGA